MNEKGQGLNAQLDGVIGFATGSNEVEQNIAASAVSLSSLQTGDAEIESFSGVARVQANGFNGNSWIVKPFVSGGFDLLSQNALTLGSGATAINIDNVDVDRFTVGYGASFDSEFGDGGYVNLRATGFRHFGDTQIGLSSQFTASSASAAGFNVVGEEIEDQFLFEGGVGKAFANDWNINASAFGEVGDISAYGARLSVGKTF